MGKFVRFAVVVLLMFLFVAPALAFASPKFGAPERLTFTPSESERAVDWTPDGLNVLWTWGDWAGQGSTYIGTLSLDSRENHLSRQGNGERAFAWSRDGSQIVFSAPSETGSDLWVMDADGSNARMVAGSHVESMFIEGAEWSADSRDLFYLTRTGPAEPTMAARISVLGGEPEILGEANAAPHLSPDGSRMAVANYTSAYIVDVDGLSQRIELPIQPGWNVYESPRWSADGSTITWLEHGFGAPMQNGDFVRRIWVADADGSNMRCAYEDSGPVWSAPHVSRDGRYVAWIEPAPDGSKTWLKVVSSSGGEVATLPGLDQAMAPLWSPVADRLIFSNLPYREQLVDDVYAVDVLEPPVLSADEFEDDMPDNMPSLLLDQRSAQERTLLPGDIDFTRVQVEAGKQYFFAAITKPLFVDRPVRMTLWPGEFGSGQPVTSLQSITGYPGSPVTEMFFEATETGSVVLEIESDPPLEGEVAYWLAGYTAGQDWFNDPFESPEWNPDVAGSFLAAGDPPLERSLMHIDDVDTVDVFVPPGDYVISTGFSGRYVPADTRLEVRDLETGSVRTNDDGPDGGPLSEVRVSASQPSVMRVRVSTAKGRDFGPYTLAVRPENATSGTIEGSVVGPSGAVVPGSTVTLVDPAIEMPFATTVSDAQGRFTFAEVPFDRPYRVQAELEGSGLVPALDPEARHLPDPRPIYRTLTAEDPSYSVQLRLKDPWVSGKVTWQGSVLPGLEVRAYDASGTVIGTGMTYYDGYKIPLPVGTTECRVEVTDPEGVYRTTWYKTGWNNTEMDLVPTPTFWPADIVVKKVSEPDVGDNVVFELAGIRIVFDRASLPGGMVVGQPPSTHAPAPGYRFVADRCYDVDPQMPFWDGASLTFSIPASEAANAAQVRMFQWENDEWNDVTANVDVNTMKVTGRVYTFTEFALMVPEPVAPPVADSDIVMGSNVSATHNGVTVTFSEVTSAGSLVVTPMAPRNPGPANFRFLPNLYFDIHPTAAFQGPATVTLPVPSGYTGDVGKLKVFHWKDNGWETITPVVDAETRMLTFVTTSFSEFGVGEPEAAEATEPIETVSTPASSWWATLLVGLLGCGLIGLLGRSRLVP